MDRWIPATLLVLVLSSSNAAAISLQWSNGASEVRFSTEARCTLVVTVDPSDNSLPSEWHLSWVTVRCPSLEVVLDTSAQHLASAVPCGWLPQSAADQRSQTRNLQMCTTSPDAPRIASYALTLPAGSAGQFLLSPANVDPLTSPTRSLGIATFNGGVPRAFPLVITGTSSQHPGPELTVQAVGHGLREPASVRVVAPDTAWSVPMTVLASTDSSLEARAHLPVLLPASVLEVEAADGKIATAALAAAPVSSQALQAASSSLFLDPNPSVVTKDFAFVFNRVIAPPPHTGWRGLFHLVYQRSQGSASSETTFGHAWSWDLQNWAVDTLAFSVDPTPWNSQHVWAPSIIQRGPKYHMYYAGVDAQGDQRIGYVTTTSLDTSNTTWSPLRQMIWESSMSAWVRPSPPMFSGQDQLRDPYVIHDPDSTGRLLLVYTAHAKVDSTAGALTAGAIRSRPGNDNAWDDLGFYRSTLLRHSSVGQLEGPHLFSVNGTNTGWRLMFSRGGSPPDSGKRTIRFLTSVPGTSPGDTAFGKWPVPVTVLKEYLAGDTTVYGWNGSEELHAGGVDYLSGYTAWGPVVQGIAISRMQWNGSNFTLQQPSIVGVDEYRSRLRGVQMRLAGFDPRARRVVFLLETPSPLDARLEVFDTMGRRLASLLSGRLPAGRSSATWVVSDGQNVALPSGVYFARLSFEGGVRAASIPIIR